MSITVPSFQEQVWWGCRPMLHLAVPKYTISKEEVDSYEKARGAVPTEGVDQEILRDNDFQKVIQAAYGKRFVYLTLDLARRLEGRTVVAITGQTWMDHYHSARSARSTDISLLTIHGTFKVPTSNGKGFWSYVTGKRASSDTEDILVVTQFTEPSLKSGEVHASRFTYGVYLFNEFYGSGSGHDPVFVSI